MDAHDDPVTRIAIGHLSGPSSSCEIIVGGTHLETKQAVAGKMQVVDAARRP